MPAGLRVSAAALSLLLHIVVVVALVRVTASEVRPPAVWLAQRLSADRLRGAGERLVEVEVPSGLTLDGIVCAGDSYIGVGVTADPRTERILMVGDNTPASRAGLQHDDIVLNPAVWQDARREGALLRLLLLRDGVKMAATVLVGKICLG